MQQFHATTFFMLLLLGRAAVGMTAVTARSGFSVCDMCHSW